MRIHMRLAILLSLLLVSSVGAQQSQGPDFGGDGIFSYVPPNGWKISEFPGLKYKISLGTPSKGFAPNIVVVDEAADVSLDDYVKSNISSMEASFPGMKILSQSDFSASDNDRAIKMVTEREDQQSKKLLRQTYYFFDAGKKKLIATCSSLAEDGAELDRTFDAAMKTFRTKRSAG